MRIEVTSSARTEIVVLSNVMQAMEQAARNAAPNEACGILLGEADRVTAFAPTRNVHRAPQTHFEIDPQALVDAHRSAREGGAQVIGYFHSHPSGDPKPSETDKAMSARDGAIWAIIGADTGTGTGTGTGAGADEIGWWRDGAQGFSALSCLIVEG